MNIYKYGGGAEVLNFIGQYKVAGICTGGNYAGIQINEKEIIDKFM
jgi:hypothetical protein